MEIFIPLQSPINVYPPCVDNYNSHLEFRKNSLFGIIEVQ